MTNETIWELIGYLGSALVLVSMFMTSIVKLRVVNTIGSIIFCVYAVVIGSMPTAVMNAALVLVNVYNIVKLSQVEKEFSFIEINEEDTALQRLFASLKTDILKYFPQFIEKYPDSKVFLIYQGMTVAGVVIGREDGNNLELYLDYTTPNYRDFSVGKFVYNELKNCGYSELLCAGTSEGHISYLKKMGFVEQGNNMYIKKL